VDRSNSAAALERFGDVKVFGYFGIDGGIPLHIPSPPRHAGERGSQNPCWRNKRHIPATGDEPFALMVASHRFPRRHICRGGVRQAIGDRTATLFRLCFMLFDDIFLVAWQPDFIEGTVAETVA